MTFDFVEPTGIADKTSRETDLSQDDTFEFVFKSESTDPVPEEEIQGMALIVSEDCIVSEMPEPEFNSVLSPDIGSESDMPLGNILIISEDFA